MVAIDTNLLVYGYREESPWHEETHTLLTELANGTQRWAVPWPCVHEFLAIVTNPRIFKPPTPIKVACDLVRAWMSSPSFLFIGEGTSYFDKLEELAVAGKVSGGAIHDARIAAICRHHGVTELWSADRDFSRFAGFKTRNPLVGAR